jgi:hypothetical protein
MGCSPYEVPIQVEQAALQIARQAPGAEAVMGANLPCLDRDTVRILQQSLREYLSSIVITEVLHGRKGGRVMINHTGIGVADVSRSAAFYDAALAALGLRRVRQIPDGVGTDARASVWLGR